MPGLLVIDDEPNLQYSLVKSLHSDAIEVVTAATAGQGIQAVRSQSPDAVILDVRLPDMSGLDAFDEIRRIDPRLPVIIITAFSTTETAIEAMKRGAFEYLLKPVDFHHLRELVSKAIELSRLRHVPAVFNEDELPDDGTVDRIVGQTPGMQEVYKAIGRVCRSMCRYSSSVKAAPEKSCGPRDLSTSPRRQGPFLAINCAAIPEGLLESELFGHEKGAFTGADRRRVGKFEQADKGTFFLDEIGDMTLATQPKLLRLLQEQHFERVGGEETIRTDVQVIAATNQDSTPKWRPVNSVTISSIGSRSSRFTCLLRNRREDLPLLISHFLRQLNATLGKHVTSVSPEALQVLENYNWPGNVRELQSIIKYAYVQSAGEVITYECLPPALRGGNVTPRNPVVAGEASRLDVADFVTRLLQAEQSEIYDKLTSAVDRVVIETVLRHAKGNQVVASELLGISRTTLRAKLRSLGLAIEKQLLPDSSLGD